MICPGCKQIYQSSKTIPHSCVNASGGCWDIYLQILAKEFSDPAWFKVHPLTVSAFFAQHPGKTPKQTRLLCMHLATLYLVLDKNISCNDVPKLQSILAKSQALQLAVPGFLGSITVQDVLSAQTFVEHEALVLEWSQQVWNAWPKQQIKSWTDKLLVF